MNDLLLPQLSADVVPAVGRLRFHILRAERVERNEEHVRGRFLRREVDVIIRGRKETANAGVRSRDWPGLISPLLYHIGHLGTDATESEREEGCVAARARDGELDRP